MKIALFKRSCVQCAFLIIYCMFQLNLKAISSLKTHFHLVTCLVSSTHNYSFISHNSNIPLQKINVVHIVYNSETLSRLKNRHYVVFVTTLSPFRKTSSSDARRTRDLRNCFVLETWKTHHETSTANSTGETSKQSNLLPYLMACELRIIRASRSNGSWLGVINDLTYYKISCCNLNHLVLSERFY